MNDVKNIVSFYGIYNDLSSENPISSLLENEKLTNEQFSDLKFYIKNLDAQAMDLDNLLKKIKSTLSPELYDGLSAEIFSVNSNLRRMRKIVATPFEDIELDELREQNKKFIENVSKLSKKVSKTYSLFEYSLNSKVENGNIPLSYLESLKKDKNLSAEQRSFVENAYNEAKLSKDEGNKTEQPTIKEEKGETNGLGDSFNINVEISSLDEQMKDDMEQLHLTKSTKLITRFNKALHYYQVAAAKQSLIHDSFMKGQVNSYADYLMLKHNLELVKTQEPLSDIEIFEHNIDYVPEEFVQQPLQQEASEYSMLPRIKKTSKEAQTLRIKELNEKQGEIMDVVVIDPRILIELNEQRVK